jgi:hypothetical protein
MAVTGKRHEHGTSADRQDAAARTLEFSVAAVARCTDRSGMPDRPTITLSTPYRGALDRRTSPASAVESARQVGASVPWSAVSIRCQLADSAGAGRGGSDQTVAASVGQIRKPAGIRVAPVPRGGRARGG